MTDRRGTITKSPDSYYKAEARALHVPSGLWHYVRNYGLNPTLALAGLKAEAERRSWTLDDSSVRYSESRKGA